MTQNTTPETEQAVSIFGPKIERRKRKTYSSVSRNRAIVTPSSITQNTPGSISQFQLERAQQLMEDSIKCGEPIFLPEDIAKTSDMFARLARMYCVDQDITWDYFEARHRAYCESIALLSNQINYDRNNFRRGLVKATMTKPFFENFCMVFGITITDLSIHIVTPTGGIHTYSLSDAEKLITRKQYENNIDCHEKIIGLHSNHKAA